ncbi:hypothetical protein D9758_014912 [Tetrapyrgos nigripes]|uniref:SUZ domain-containing protein n=1 Tax=Tetrapyrgos nigripes TaxID=182062 RepID=A0A8H5F9S6_9AGAR|nr:hypothetical protein D9758_018875 [Tetrapyrgos nigripes]KAF5337611.1 hypothetical protein D9758_014912 [Tetrapyrgos nigripes]
MVTPTILQPSPASGRVDTTSIGEDWGFGSDTQDGVISMFSAGSSERPSTSPASGRTDKTRTEDADSSDVEPSEASSMGGRSNATGGSGKKWMTIEEREAAYNAARNRISMDFEEKEKEKEKEKERW